MNLNTVKKFVNIQNKALMQKYISRKKWLTNSEAHLNERRANDRVSKGHLSLIIFKRKDNVIRITCTYQMFHISHNVMLSYSLQVPITKDCCSF